MLSGGQREQSRVSPYHQNDPESEEVEVCRPVRPRPYPLIFRPFIRPSSHELPIVEFLQPDQQPERKQHSQRSLHTYRTPGN